MKEDNVMYYNLLDEAIWVSEDLRSYMPDVINSKYLDLKTSIQENNGYKAILCAKDFFEIIMKVPVVYALSMIDSYISNDNSITVLSEEEILAQNDKTSRETYELSKKLAGVLGRALKDPLAMGSWRELVKSVIANATIFDIPLKLVYILSETDKLFDKSVSNGNGGSYPNIVNWRNEVIGHGATQRNGEFYWYQIYDLIKVIRDYFEIKANGNSINELYSNFEIKNDCDGKIALWYQDKCYEMKEFMRIVDESCLYFDSFYSSKHVVKLSDYFEISHSEKNNPYFEDLYKLYLSLQNNKRRRRVNGTSTGEDRRALASLHTTVKYQKPVKLIKKLNERMDEMGSGVIFLQMERGMGKSALSHVLDGRYLKTALQEDLKSIVRTYHIKDLQLKGQKDEDKDKDEKNSALDFYRFLKEESFTKQVSVDDIVSDNPDVTRLQANIEVGIDAKKSLAELLCIYRDAYVDVDEFEEELSEEYDDNRLILIIDGIDELNGATASLYNGPLVKTNIKINLVNHILPLRFTRAAS